jgi:hypothetical protein
MGRLHERVIEAVAAEMTARTDWDERPPSLYFLYVEGGVPRLSDITVPPEIWKLGRSADVLTSMAYMFETGQDWIRHAVAIDAPGLHGIGFMTEAWQVTSDPKAMSFEEQQRLKDDAENHRIADRLDAVEIRHMLVVDRAGITYQANHVRGSDHVDRQVFYPKVGQKYTLTGSVIDALDRILTAVLGVITPPRVEPQWPTRPKG